MGELKKVTIVVTALKTGEDYVKALSYPDKDYDDDGLWELYSVPVYKVLLKTAQEQHEWRALRFMPYWNDPRTPSTHYKARGWVNAGLRYIPERLVRDYNPYYNTSNRPSPYAGAIRVERSFLIHAGPINLEDPGWGAAGCIEIVGDFAEFKKDLKMLSGSTAQTADQAILDMVKQQKLFVIVEAAVPPDFRQRVVGYCRPRMG